MARISTYPNDTYVTGIDKWIGSDADNSNITKNFTADAVASYYNRVSKIATGFYAWQFTPDTSPANQASMTFQKVSYASGSINLTGFQGVIRISNITLANTQPGTFIQNEWLNKIILATVPENPSYYAFYRVTAIVQEGLNYLLTLTFLSGNNIVISQNSPVSFGVFSEVPGTSGTAGTSGTSGTTGTSGVSGSSGTSGTTGTSGTSGVSGSSGTSGTSGTNGTSGITGTSGTNGTSGSSGTAGTSGANGVSSSYFPYIANSAIVGNPGDGRILWNNATQISSNLININHLTNTPVTDVDAFLSLIQIGQTLIIQDQNDPANFQKWTVSATPILVTGASNYWKIGVNFLASGGNPQFANNQNIILAITSFSGTNGTSGTSGTGSVTNVSALTLTTMGDDVSSTVENGTTTPVITLNLPTASATNRGALSPTDWITFNSKANALSGTINSVSKFTSPSAIGNSNIKDTGSLITLGSDSYVNGNLRVGVAIDAGFKLDVGGTARIQSDIIVNEIAIGKGGGNNNLNTIVGNNAGQVNTTGSNNSFFGRNAAQANTTGFQNTFIGVNTGNANQVGNGNTLIGANSGFLLNSSFNTALGAFSMDSLTTGVSNTAVGYDALEGNSTGSNSVALGTYAAKYISDGSTVATTIGNSVFLGSYTKPLGDSQVNQIVIGYNTTGLGSNTTVLGNSSTTTAAIYGNLLLGTTTDSGFKLDVTGDTIFRSLAGVSDRVLYSSATGVLTQATIGSGLTFSGGVLSATGTASGSIGGSGTSGYVPKFTGTAAIGNSNIQDSGTLITLGSNSYVNGGLGIGTSAFTSYNLRINKPITGATTAFGLMSEGAIQSDVTTVGYYIRTTASTQATTFTLGTLSHFFANQGTLGAGSTVTTQTGFWVSPTLIGATTNLGFRGQIPAQANAWNIYMDGTANNYMAGSLAIGTTNITSYNLRVAKNITGGTDSYGISQSGIVQNDVTSNAFGYYNALVTQATSFTLTSYTHFRAVQATIGAGSTITNQSGFSVSSTLTGATNNYGFLGSIPAGTNRWNIYMDGTANNYMAGALGIGTTTLTAISLNIGKTITGGTTAVGINQQGVVQSDVTSTAFGFASTLNTQATAFTLSNYVHFRAFQQTIGAGSVVTTQSGYLADSGMIGATNNYGFRGQIPAGGTNRWNLYMDGTAQNYLAGASVIGAGTTVGGTGRILTVTLTNGGSGYVDGTYTNVGTTAINSSGVYSIFTVVVSGGIVTSPTLTWGGVNYAVGDTITISNTLLGGSGSGLVLTVATAETDTLRIQGATNAARLTIQNTTTTINANDEIGAIRFSGRDSSSGASGTQAYIQAVSIGTNAGADLVFGLKSSTVYTSATEDMRLRGNTGALLIGSSSQVSTLTKLEVTGQGYFSDSVGIGTTSLAGYSLRSSKTMTGSTVVYAFSSDGTIQSDVTSQAYGFRSAISTAAASFTLTDLYQFRAQNATLGAGSTIGTQYGFGVADLTSGVINYAFESRVSAGTNKWNLYMSGTANNYMAGSLGIGTTSLTQYNLRVSKTISGSTDSAGIYQNGTVQSDVTSTGIGYANQLNTQAATFTLTNYRHFSAIQQSIGAGNTIANQAGYYADSSIIGGTANFGFHGNIPAGTNRWNLFMNGTAQNYLAGALSIGVSTANSSALLQVDSTAQGVLFPRMTTTQKNAISSPATGLVVFDTTLGKLCVFSTTWQTITSA